MKDSQIDFVCPAPVAAACASGYPLVALESTLISHGLPHPENIEVARGAEAAVRAAGAEPATMAVIDGRPHAGLDGPAMERLATEGGVKKLSRRDLPAADGSSDALDHIEPGRFCATRSTCRGRSSSTQLRVRASAR